MCERVRSDFDAALDELPEVVPRHRRHVLEVFSRRARDLGNVERTTVVCVGGTGKDRRRHAQPLEHLEPRLDVRVRIVEGHVQQPGAARHCVPGADRSEAAPEEAPDLQLERPGSHGQ